MIFKFLDKDLNQLEWGVDITSKLSSVKITNTMDSGSTLEAIAPLTKITRNWFNKIRESIINNDGDSSIIIADIKNDNSYYIIDSIEISEKKNDGNSTIKIMGKSIDKLLETRLSTKKEYVKENLSFILSDLIKGCGYGGENNETYPYELSNLTDREDRFVKISNLQMNIVNDVSDINFDVDSDYVGHYVSDLLKTYGKRMYSVYDEIGGRLNIIIDDGEDKTFNETGLKFIISSEDETINEISYNMNRNERLNVLIVNDGDESNIGYINDKEGNPSRGINRRESFSSNSSTDNQESIDQQIAIEFINSSSALEKINVKAEFGNKFDFGTSSNQVYVGDLVSVSVFDEEGNRIIVDDILSEMNIIIDIKKTSSLVPTYIPTIGTDDTDDDGNFITRRAKLNLKSSKNIQRAPWK